MELKLREGAKVSLAFALVYAGTIGYQAYVKLSLAFHAKKTKQEFNRYDGSNSHMVMADRISGNLLEWSPVFAGAFWAALILCKPEDEQGVLRAGWFYILFRALYPFVVRTGAIGRSGAKPHILIATLPAYGALLYLTAVAVQRAFF